MKKGTFILLGIIALLIIVIIAFPNGTKKLLRKAYQKLDSEHIEQVKSYDSIQNIRLKDSLKYMKELQYLNNELNTVILNQKQELKKLQLRNYRNEQELYKYRNGDFDNKFKLFSRTVIRKDSI